ncbi:hypothetical protein M5K25_014907 [Dendrobium thyrsiflorum]|uniref:Uncharacterized protein n=1 Tax=Dendrobium thyrsiflorum TaxID=117978 RepID=A0ABD0UPN4_DENTH
MLHQGYKIMLNKTYEDEESKTAKERQNQTTLLPLLLMLGRSKSSTIWSPRKSNSNDFELAKSAFLLRKEKIEY